MTNIDPASAALAGYVRGLPDETLWVLAQGALARGAIRREVVEAPHDGADAAAGAEDERAAARTGAALLQGMLQSEWRCQTTVELDGTWLLVLVRPRSTRESLRDIERAVLELARQGVANNAVAKKLGLPQPGVSAHLKLGLSRVGLANVFQLVRLERAAAASKAGRVLLRGALVSPDLAVMALELSPGQPDDGLSTLTRAQREVAAMAVEGMRNEEIGRARGCSARTVSNQLRAVYVKLGLSSRRQLAARMTAGALSA